VDRIDKDSIFGPEANCKIDDLIVKYRAPSDRPDRDQAAITKEIAMPGVIGPAVVFPAHGSRGCIEAVKVPIIRTKINRVAMGYGSETNWAASEKPPTEVACGGVKGSHTIGNHGRYEDSVTHYNGMIGRVIS
jgi:hypothetical protein